MDNKNQPMDKIGVDKRSVIATHMTMLPSENCQDHQPTITRVISKNILEASLGVDHPRWSMRGAKSQSITAIDYSLEYQLIY